MKYKHRLKVIITRTRKCDCLIKLHGKPNRNEKGWVLCDNHNHELSDTLVGHLYADRLKLIEQSIVIDMTNSLVKLINILLMLKENNKDNY